MSRPYLAALDPATGAVTPWAPQPDYFVEDIALGNNSLYVAGLFSEIGGQARAELAALDLQTGQATTWQPQMLEQFPAGRALALEGANAYVASDTTIYAFDATSGAQIWRSLYPPTSQSSADVLTASDTALYIHTPGLLYALTTSNGTRTSWNPQADGPVRALLASGGLVYAAGSFHKIGGQERHNIAALDGTSGAATSWAPNPGGSSAAALALEGETLAVGGAFSIGELARRNLAAIDLTTGTATSWNPGADAPVRALALSGETLYAGGDFKQIGGQPHSYLAALDRATGVATSWSPEPDGPVGQIAPYGSTLFISGAFTHLGDQPRALLGAVRADSGAATSWNPAPSGGVFGTQVNDIAIHGDTLYTGGNFTQIGGQARYLLASFEARSGAITPWAPEIVGGSLSAVYALEPYNTLIYAAGCECSNIITNMLLLAFESASGEEPPTWKPPTVTSYPLYSVAASGKNLYTASTNILKVWDATSGLAREWEISITNGVALESINLLEASGGMILVGGRFTTIEGAFQPNFAVLRDPSAPAVTSAPSTLNTTSATLHGTVTAPAGALLSFQVTPTSGAYGNAAAFPATPGTSAGTGPIDVSATVSNLVPATTYYYRIVITQDSGVITSDEGWFRTLDTPGAAPELRTFLPLTQR